MGIGSLFNLILIQPIFNLLLIFLFVFSTWKIPGSLGWAIIALTTFFRVVFNPFYKKQMEMAAKMEEIRPRLEKIQKKYKKDPQKMQQEQLKIYQKEGINPASGCLLGIVQFPLIIALYRVLLDVFQNGNLAHISEKVSKIAYFDFLKITQDHIDPWFFGFNLGITPSQFQEYGLYYLAIPVITGILQYLQVATSQPGGGLLPGMGSPENKASNVKDGSEGALEKSKKKSDKANASGKDESFQAVFQKQMKFMFPLMVGYFAYILPTGLSLYWNVFSIFSILQARKRNAQLKKA